MWPALAAGHGAHTVRPSSKLLVARVYCYWVLKAERLSFLQCMKFGILMCDLCAQEIDTALGVHALLFMQLWALRGCAAQALCATAL